MSTHGTDSMYRQGCRCDSCRRAHRLAHAKWRREASWRQPPTHDRNGYNNYGCRCTVCCEASRAYFQARRAA